MEGEPDFEDKENIILTVGRIGSRQKATDSLIMAFSTIAKRLDGWKLRLVGEVEEDFKPRISEIIRTNPHLLDSVEFVGSIEDKEILGREYRKAKIFCMPSRYEGGTPNVMSEALHGGCAIAVTKFDAYLESTDSGRCGKSCEIDDIEGIADMLSSMARDEEWLKQACHNAYNYAKEHFDMEKIVARIFENLMEAKDCTA